MVSVARVTKPSSTALVVAALPVHVQGVVPDGKPEVHAWVTLVWIHAPSVTRRTTALSSAPEPKRPEGSQTPKRTGTGVDVLRAQSTPAFWIERSLRVEAQIGRAHV